MALRIRFLRMGRKKRPFYRLVVTEARTKPQGPYIEELGYYDPLTEPPEVKLEEEAILEWLKKGAQPSESALSLLKKAGIWDKFLEMKKKSTGGVEQ